MRLPLFVLAAATVLATAVALPARAQRPTIGLSAGPSLPASTLNESHKPGFNVAAHVAYRRDASAVGFRLEAFYNRFDNTDFSCVDDCILPGISDRPVRVTGAAADVLFNFGQAGAGLYVIGGGGPYNVNVGRSESSTNLGFNVGAGARFRLANLGAFLEARFHTIAYELGAYDPKVEYIPITFGIEF